MESILGGMAIGLSIAYGFYFFFDFQSVQIIHLWLIFMP